MTLITGQVSDVGMNDASGMFYARAAEFRGDGQVVVTTAPATFAITDGEVSAEVAPGPTIITLHVGPIRKDWFVNVPEANVGLGDLIATYTTYEPAVVSAAIKARDAAIKAHDAAIKAKGEAEQAVVDADAKRAAAEAAANLTGSDRLHVDNVRALLDETYNQSQAGMALPPRLTETALNATYGPEKVKEVIASDAAAPGGVIAKRGGRTKMDGQNIENLRRPTLVVDNQWPNASHDHSIVWVNEQGMYAYAIGQDGGLRKSTWTNTVDGPFRFSYSYSRAPAGSVWCENGVFLELPNGVILLEQRAGSAVTLQRSTNSGATFSTVWTAPTGVTLLGPASVARDDVTGYLYLVEYTTAVSVTEANIWRSTDDGATWAVWKTLVRDESTAPGRIRHIHSARFDPVSERMHFCFGDMQADAGIYRVNAAGTDVEPVVTNADIRDQFAPLYAPARSVDLMFFPGHIAWGSDGAGGQDHVFRLNRATGDVEKIAAIDSTGWYAQRASDDGSMWVLSTSSEAVPGHDLGVMHLYAVSDDGATVDEIAASSMVTTSTIGSISCLGGASGAGNTFWLRAHTYSVQPHASKSAFQMRCRIGHGVVQLKPPAPARRPAPYLRQGRNGRVALTAGEASVFAVATVPPATTQLVLLDYGASSVEFVSGTAVLEVWNQTAGEMVFTSDITSRRNQVGGATDAHLELHYLTAGHVLQFRLRNIHASAAITALGFVEFGFDFPN